jgi:hypothetical protein
VKFETALGLFRAIYAAYIVYASAKTLVHVIHAGHGAVHAHAFIIALASLEIAAALTFLFVRFERAACAMLLTIYAIAAVLTVTEGAVPAHLIYYAATALFIVAAGRHVRVQRASAECL